MPATVVGIMRQNACLTANLAESSHRVSFYLRLAVVWHIIKIRAGVGISASAFSITEVLTREERAAVL